MAYNPDREDYDRMVVRFMEDLMDRDVDDVDDLDVEQEIASFRRRYTQERDSLPQTDVERAFHLVATATSIIDYELPFADDEQADQLITQARNMLDEALALDPNCFDARRMKAAATAPTFEAHYVLLKQACDATCDACLAEAKAAVKEMGGEIGNLVARIALRPAVRLLATLASKAVICGHNHEAIKWYKRALELDPLDEGDIRFTAAIAYAKLEDEEGLEQLARDSRALGVGRPHDEDDAWVLISRMAIAYKQRDLTAARTVLKHIIKVYPNAALTLIAMHELPDGVFARLYVEPFSEDELIMAVSECTVLFQEGVDREGHGSLGAWAIRCARELDPSAAEYFDRVGERRND